MQGPLDAVTGQQAQKMIFVVGNSRSGTTMMGRVLGLHQEVFTFRELHFFEQLWNPQPAPQAMSRERATRLMAQLLAIQRYGYYARANPRSCREEADAIVRGLPPSVTPPELFSAFLSIGAYKSGKTIPCDQTPRNVYYLREILELYPQAYVVNMIRDPRDVLFSQKNRWRRRSLGSHVPLRHTIRLWVDYHPITISVLWNSGIRAGECFSDHSRVFQLRFEDLLSAPEERVRELCFFVGLKFRSEMLQVPQEGSSHRPDRPDRLGIDHTVVGRWRHNGLSTSEIFISQKLTHKNMTRYGYELVDVRPSVPGLILQWLAFIIKSGLAVLFNVNRVRNIRDAVQRRLGK
jgi:hypothetical protein